MINMIMLCYILLLSFCTLTIHFPYIFCTKFVQKVYIKYTDNTKQRGCWNKWKNKESGLNYIKKVL